MAIKKSPTLCHVPDCYALRLDRGYNLEIFSGSNPLYCSMHQTIKLPGEPEVHQTPPQSPAPSPNTADLLGTVLEKLEAAIAVNDSLTAKIEKIEEMLRPPVAVYRPEKLTAEQHKKLREFCTNYPSFQSSPILSSSDGMPDLLTSADPDNVILPLDIDADLLARLERHLKLWTYGKSVNAAIVEMIEEYLPRTR